MPSSLFCIEYTNFTHKSRKIETYIPYTKLVEHLQLKESDNVYLVSDISRLMMKAIEQEGKFQPAELIKSFQDHLQNGLLFIPGFVNTLEDGATIDMRTLKPETGGLSKEAFSQFKKGLCCRTNDPFHSFFIYGKNAEQVAASTFDNRDTFGVNSVFGYLHKAGGVLLIVDLDLYYGFTFAHYVEQQKKVSYRESKPYNFSFTDAKGNTAITKYYIYAKKKGYNPVLNSLKEPLVSSEALEIFNLNGVNFYKINIQKAYSVLENDIISNKARNLINFNLSLYLKQTIKSITG